MTVPNDKHHFHVTRTQKVVHSMSDQLVVQAIVRPTSVGTETLSFSFNLGPLKVVCIANIPAEGEESAPAYIKLQLPPSSSGSLSQSNGRTDTTGNGSAVGRIRPRNRAAIAPGLVELGDD